MNIRISSRDLQALQRRALDVSGGLEDVVANKLARQPRDARG